MKKTQYFIEFRLPGGSWQRMIFDYDTLKQAQDNARRYVDNGSQCYFRIAKVETIETTIPYQVADWITEPATRNPK